MSIFKKVDKRNLPRFVRPVLGPFIPIWNFFMLVLTPIRPILGILDRIVGLMLFIWDKVFFGYLKMLYRFTLKPLFKGKKK